MEEETQPHFFKAMVGDFKKRLQIPQEFLKHISKVPSEKAILIGPSGSRWNVRVNRASDGLYLEQGWEIFSQDQSLSKGEFVVFKHEGDMSFTVRIYGTSLVEREDTLGVIFSQEMNKLKGRKRLGRPLKVKIKTQIRSRSISLRPCSSDQNAQLHGEENGVEQGTPHQFGRSVSPKDVPDRSETDRAVQVAKNLKLKNPSYIVIMKPSYKYYMPLPAWFVKKYFTEKTENVTLTVSNGWTWRVRCCKGNDGYYKLYKGWKGLRAAMSLKNGNICVFELIDRNNILLKVHILRDT